MKKEDINKKSERFTEEVFNQLIPILRENNSISFFDINSKFIEEGIIRKIIDKNGLQESKKRFIEDSDDLFEIKIVGVFRQKQE